MATVITSSLTIVSGQTAASSASLVTSWPAWVTRQATAKGFGGRWTTSGPHHRRSSRGRAETRQTRSAAALAYVVLPASAGRWILGIHRKIFSIFQQFFTISSGLWPGRDAKLPPQNLGAHGAPRLPQEYSMVPSADNPAPLVGPLGFCRAVPVGHGGRAGTPEQVGWNTSSQDRPPPFSR